MPCVTQSFMPLPTIRSRPYESSGTSNTSLFPLQLAGMMPPAAAMHQGSMVPLLSPEPQSTRSTFMVRSMGGADGNMGMGMGGGESMGMAMHPGQGNSFLIRSNNSHGMAPQDMNVNLYSGGGQAAGVTGVNPLYGSAPSPMGSQLGMNGAMSSGLYGSAAPAPGNATPPSPPGGAASVNEAEMLQQLMGEISRLKNELGGAAPR